MKTKQRNKWISISLMVAMLLALLPPLTASAAPVLNITNLYVHTDPNPADPPATEFKDSSVQRFTTNPITLSVDINGIPREQVSEIYYEITNVTTGITTPNRTNRPVVNSDSNNQITFQNVELTEGLNRVVIKFESTSSIPSLPGWAYFTPVSNITNLKINDDILTDGGMFPSSGPYTNVNITGNANNAYQVNAIVNGTTFEASNFYNGIFTFLTNTGRNTDINLKPGDNQIQFISKNPTNYYTTSREFKYDNGLGFAYNGNVRFMSEAASADKKLITEPTLESATEKDITFTADIKNSKGNITASVLDYVYAEISVAGAASFRYTFANGGSISNVNGTLSGGGAITPVVSLKDTTSKYNTYQLSVSMPLSLSATTQQIEVKLVSSTGYPNTPTTYLFNYTNPALPYLKSVAQQFNPIGGPQFEVNLSEQGTSQINEFPAKLNIYANANTQNVNVNIPGFAGNGDYAVTQTSPGIYRATVDLHDLTDGLTTMTIIPKDSGGTLNNAGKKIYSLNISGAPYVIVTNLYNGKVVKSKGELSCGGVGGLCITGKIVNLPPANYPLVKLSINNVDIPISKSTAPVGSLIDSNGNFTITEDALNALFGGTASGTAFSSLFDADGKKSIKFSLYLKPGTEEILVTQSNYDVFVLSDYAPIIERLVPNVNLTPSTDGDTTGSYLTSSSVLQLAGTLRNAELNTEAILYLRKAPSGANMTPPTLVANGGKQEVSADQKSYKLDFGTTTYTMDQFGDYVFEIVAKNNSGRTTSKMITITKQPVSYILLQPNNFVKNADKIDQANVNTNFQTVIIQADGADSVLFGKVAAIQTEPGKFRYDAASLKAGKNTITFEITRGPNKVKGTFILMNQNTPIEGAQFRTTLTSKMSVFNGELQLSFPKDTKVMRNDRTASEQFITADRKLVFGIANQDDGRVDKASEIAFVGTRFLQESTGRFRPASKLFWVDAGEVDLSAADNNDTLKAALQGTGNLPIPSNPGPGEKNFFSRYIKSIMIPTQHGTMTLKYDSDIRTDSWKYVTVYQYGTFLDPSGSGNQYVGWKNIGGVVDAKSHTIKVPVETFGYFQVMYMDNSFNDVTSHDWARDYLDVLYSKGVMNNKTTGQFLPNDAITRGEFVTLLVKGFDIPLINDDTSYHTNDPTNPNFQGTFADVRRGLGLPNSSSLFDFMHIEAGARTGIVRGNSNGLFLPNNSISREDAAVMIARAANMKVNSDTDKSMANLKKQFTDADDSIMSTYAMPSVEAVVKAGYMDGIKNVPVEGQKKDTFSFDPKGNMTRAQASAIVYRVMQQSGNLPK